MPRLAALALPPAMPLLLLLVLLALALAASPWSATPGAAAAAAADADAADAAAAGAASGAASPHRPRPVLVLAQGRSGSSFLSSWFNAHPKAFYLLEPCGMAYQQRIESGDLAGGRCARLMRELQRCDFSHVALNRDQKPLIPDTALGFTGWGHKKDASLCNSSQVVVTKELRVGWLWVRSWMPAGTGSKSDRETSDLYFDPSTKFIVILRDPRAVRSSRQEGWPQPSRSGTPEDFNPHPRAWNGRAGMPYDQSVRSMCAEHAALREKAKANPDRVMLIEYTDVLKDPMDLARRVFSFVGMDLAPEVAEHIDTNTKGKCEFEGKPFSLCRKLDKPVDDKWRKTLKKENLDELMAIKECRALVQSVYGGEGGGEGGEQASQEEL